MSLLMLGRAPCCRKKDVLVIDGFRDNTTARCTNRRCPKKFWKQWPTSELGRLYTSEQLIPVGSWGSGREARLTMFRVGGLPFHSDVVRAILKVIAYRFDLDIVEHPLRLTGRWAAGPVWLRIDAEPGIRIFHEHGRPSPGARDVLRWSGAFFRMLFKYQLPGYESAQLVRWSYDKKKPTRRQIGAFLKVATAQLQVRTFDYIDGKGPMTDRPIPSFFTA